MIRIFRSQRNRAIEQLRQWAESLRSQPEVLAVVLFGSVARGDCTASSDADLLVILRDSPLPFHHRIPSYRPRGVCIPTDVFPYTLSEVRASLAEGWGVAPVALAEGIALLGKEAVRQLREEPHITPM